MIFYELIEKHYFFELERKEKINQQASLTVVLGGAYIALLNLQIKGLEVVGVLSGVAFAFLTLSLAAFIIFCVRFIGFFGHNYYYIADADDLARVFYAAKAYDDKVQREPKQIDVFERDLIESYARASAANREANNRKSALLLISNQAVFVALIFAAIAYLFGHSLGQ